MNKNRSLFISTQLFSFNLYRDKEAQFERKLTLAKEKMGLNALMIGANLNPEEIDLVIRWCKKSAISPYLWYPVLADNPPGIDVSQLKLSGYGEDHETYILEEQRNTGEDFGFLCPVKTYDDHDFFKFYEQYLETHEFQGVFLDKIRYPSPANGLSALLGCQCDVCRQEYHKRNIDPEQMFKKAQIGFETSKKPDDITKTLFQNKKALQAFFNFREEKINRLVDKLVNIARKRGLHVGVDLFAPSLAKIVSQDYSKLSKMADWIKPMLYLKTMGPAGIPMEIISLIKILKKKNHFFSESDMMHFISDFIGMDLPETIDQLQENGVTTLNFTNEIKKASINLTKLQSEVYPGFEAVDFPPICSMDPKTLLCYLEEILKNKLNGFVLSWDISRIPETYLNLVGDFFGQSRH